CPACQQGRYGCAVAVAAAGRLFPATAGCIRQRCDQARDRSADWWLLMKKAHNMTTEPDVAQEIDPEELLNDMEKEWMQDPEWRLHKALVEEMLNDARKRLRSKHERFH